MQGLHREGTVINGITHHQQAAIDAVDAPIAVLDEAGVVRAVNRAWVSFGLGNGRLDDDTDIGRPYPAAAELGVRAVVEGSAESASVCYPCHSPMEQRWYRMLAVRLAHGGTGSTLVVHRRLADPPRPEELEAASAELALRWRGIRTICAWCDQRVRKPLGGWEAGTKEAGTEYSHGICNTCAETLMPPAEEPARPAGT